MSNNPEGVFVRASTPDDALIIQQHASLSIEESHLYRGAASPLPHKQDDVSFVSGVGTTVFGSLVLSQLSETKWTISHVFVEQAAREIGLGDALVVHALKYLQSKNASWIGAQAQPGDRALKNLFERHGLVAQTILVGKSLSDPSTAEDAFQ